MPRNDDPNLMRFRLSGLPQNLDKNQVQQELERITGITFSDCYYIPQSKFEDAVDTVCYLKIKPEEEQQLWVLDKTTVLDGPRRAFLKQMEGPPGAGNLGTGVAAGSASNFKRPQNFENNDDANKRPNTGGIPGPAGSRPAVCLCYATIDATGRHIWAPLTDPVTFDNESVSRVFGGASTINGGASTTVNQYFTGSAQANGNTGGSSSTPRGRGGGYGGGGRGGGGYTPRGGGRGGGGGGSGGGWGDNSGGASATSSGGGGGGGGGGWDDDTPAKPAPVANGGAKPAGGDDGWGGGGDSAPSAATTPAKAPEPAKKEEPAAAASDDW